jgi:hypothetical protein
MEARQEESTFFKAVSFKALNNDALLKEKNRPALFRVSSKT